MKKQIITGLIALSVMVMSGCNDPVSEKSNKTVNVSGLYKTRVLLELNEDGSVAETYTDSVEFDFQYLNFTDSTCIFIYNDTLTQSFEYDNDSIYYVWTETLFDGSTYELPYSYSMNGDTLIVTDTDSEIRHKLTAVNQ